MKISFGSYVILSDGTRMSALENDGGGHNVLFTQNDGTKTKCDECPSFLRCQMHRGCLKGEDFVVEGL